MVFTPTFRYIKENRGTFGEQSKICADVLAKFFELDSGKKYALHDLFYTLTYELEMKSKKPEEHDKLVQKHYKKVIGLFGSDEKFGHFLSEISKVSYVIMMYDEHLAVDLADEMRENLDAVARLNNQPDLFFHLIGTNYYNWKGVVPTSCTDEFAKERAKFYAYYHSDYNILVGTIPKDASASKPKQPDEMVKEKPISAISKASKLIFPALFVFVMLILAYLTLGPLVGLSADDNQIVKDIRATFLDWKNTMYHTKNCTANVSNGDCFDTKPLYCNNGKIENKSDICGCDSGFRPHLKLCIPTVNCSDGSLSPDCSQNKPYQCLNGTLVSMASVCGCPENYMPANDTCEEIKRCTDGTIYGQCSKNQPLICDNGALHERASVCGCPEGLTIESIGNTNGERCIINRNLNTQTSVVSTPANLYDVETQIHALINEQRTANGLSAINFDETLSSIARKHSQDMAARGYFEHDTPEGHDFYWRMQQDGYNCAIPIGNTIYQGAENIFKESGYSTSAIASTTVKGWMSSSGHRANILTPYWRNEGIGVAKSSSGTIYVTQDFC